MSSYQVLLMLTSHSRLGYTNQITGVDLSQFETCYRALVSKDIKITLCSVKGGALPIDPAYDIDLRDNQQQASRDSLMEVLASSKTITHVDATKYDAIIICGGYGVLWDLTCDPDAVSLLDSFHSSDKYICALSHASGALIHVTREDDSSVLEGKRVTGYSNAEELMGNRAAMIPFFVEEELVRCGAIYTAEEASQVHVEIDGKLITGQNPASVALAVDTLLAALNES
ncbi:type 1 glutamine amidotransferase domain-containing protein [Vibrio methylphosphonaticus]|uniref:type 1 glutamine amidotransferase domain-containing protein n=1 Tax=Vibrio methylphosphonaticus TaxID=2946866 RepID=UPI00202A6DA4|nr:type 1 glutamine amidotransferase domain-containing protein [Vibrio methylphosphonaticus]MCL9773631.1 type 1 glutamine amidotransferase domain-containing protein [Vibrio methylphosphonaticus]